MALSNIFREPRREITESAVGLAAFGAVIGLGIWPDYLFAQWFYIVTGGEKGNGCPWPLGMVFGVIFGVMGILLFCVMLAATHAWGDSICDALQRRGIHLRPRQRY